MDLNEIYPEIDSMENDLIAMRRDLHHYAEIDPSGRGPGSGSEPLFLQQRKPKTDKKGPAAQALQVFLISYEVVDQKLE